MIKLAKIPFIILIRGYQFFVSPLFVGHCRYDPTCSQYAANAIEGHGVRKGILLIIKRMARCQPWGSWGFDPVPPASKKNESNQPANMENSIAQELRQRYIRARKNVFLWGK